MVYYMLLFTHNPSTGNGKIPGCSFILKPGVVSFPPRAWCGATQLPGKWVLVRTGKSLCVLVALRTLLVPLFGLMAAVRLDPIHSIEGLHVCHIV